jgi:hypothetical protein
MNDPSGINTGGKNGGGVSIYRYMGNGIMDYYPTTAVAMSWDVNWQNPQTIDCNGLVQGPDMKFNPAKLIQKGASSNSAVVNTPNGLYYYLPAFSYSTSNGGPGNMPQTLVFNRNIYLDGSGNLILSIPGYYEVTTVANSFNERATFNVTVTQVTNGTTISSRTSTSGSEYFAQNAITAIFKVDTTPSYLIVAVTSSGNDHSRSSWTSVKWISQVSDSSISATQPSTPLISPGSVANSALVNSVGGLYYYLPAFSYSTSTGGPGNMPQTLVYGNGITVDDSGNLQINVPGYYEVTTVGNSFNETATFEITITQFTNGVAVKSELSRSGSEYFAQNAITVIFKVDTIPSGIVVNLRSSGNDHSRSSWTTVKWISM